MAENQQFLTLVESKRSEIETMLGDLADDEKRKHIALTLRAIMNPESHVPAGKNQAAQCEKIRNCTDESKFNCLIASATTRLAPGTTEKLAYLIPYGRELTFAVDYKGLIKNTIEAGVAKDIYAELVYEHDSFEETSGTRRELIHKPKRFGDRGKLIGVYAVAVFPDGSTNYEILEMKDLDAIEKAALRISGGEKSPAWASFPGEMQKKSAIRRLVKRLKGKRPAGAATAALEAAFELDRHQFRTEEDEPLDVPMSTTGTPAPTPHQPKAENKRIEVKKDTPKQPEQDRVLTDAESDALHEKSGAVFGSASQTRRFLQTHFGVTDFVDLKLSQYQPCIEAMEQTGASE